ncbi:MAG: DUF3159 domain-containing protein [Actinomycetaceae bacterium]|nr:DUF3159 domain-containing protein [Actinomycetaceae bacterium]
MGDTQRQTGEDGSDGACGGTNSGGRGLAAVLAAEFDPWAAVGGVRGLIETTVPGVIFLIAYLITENVAVSVTAPLVAATVILLVRLVQRLDVMPALGAFGGVAVSAFWAMRTGQAENYFQIGILTNAAYFLGLIVSLALRWPALGLIIGFLRGDPTGWRSGPASHEPEAQLARRRYTLITWIWTALFALRLALQVPLYYAGATEALAVVRLILGPFAFILVAWFTWLLVRGLPPIIRDDEDDEGDDGEGDTAEEAAGREEDASAPDGKDTAAGDGADVAGRAPGHLA